MKSGGAWVPIDPDHPADRTAYILESAGPACVLTTARDAVDLPAGIVSIEIDTIDLPALDTRTVTDADRLAPLRPENTAYVIYTSGSTGRPKGVAVSHAAIDNQLEWMLHEYPMTESDAYLQKTGDHVRRVAVGLLHAAAGRCLHGDRHAGRAPRPGVRGEQDRRALGDRDRLRAVDADGVRRERPCRVV